MKYQAGRPGRVLIVRFEDRDDVLGILQNAERIRK
jgi:hypothetical protein